MVNSCHLLSVCQTVSRSLRRGEGEWRERNFGGLISIDFTHSSVLFCDPVFICIITLGSKLSQGLFSDVRLQLGTTSLCKGSCDPRACMIGCWAIRLDKPSTWSSVNRWKTFIYGNGTSSNNGASYNRTRTTKGHVWIPFHPFTLHR